MIVATVILGVSLMSVTPSPTPLSMFEGRIETQHFLFYHHQAQRRLAQDLASLADRARGKVLADLGTDHPDGTKVYLANSMDEMRRLAPAGVRVPPWAAALAFPRENLILINTSSGWTSADKLQQVFLHEWAHLALDHAVGQSWLPRWFKEGFAIYQSGEWSFERTRSLASGVISGRLFSLRDLDWELPQRFLDVELAYAQSIDFVSFLLGEYGQAPFHQLIDLSAKGWSFFLALEQVYHQDLFSLERAWQRDLKIRFTWIPLVTGAASLWILATLVLVAAYLRRRRKKLQALQAMEDDLDVFSAEP